MNRDVAPSDRASLLGAFLRRAAGGLLLLGLRAGRTVQLVALAVVSLPCVAAELTFQETVVIGAGDVPAFQPIGVVVPPDGRHVYVFGQDDESLIARFERDRATGALTYLSQTQVGSGLYVPEIAAAPDGCHLYAATSDGVAVFARNLGTGALTDAGFVPFGSGPLAGVSAGSYVAVSGDGLHVYVTTTDPGAVSVFARNVTTGALTHVENEVDDAVRHLEGLQRVVLSPDGEHAYAFGAYYQTQLFERDPASGALSFVGDTGSVLGSPTDLEMSADGTGVYTAIPALVFGVYEFNRFPRNPSTGALGPPLTGVTAGYASDLAADPDGGHLYAAGDEQIAILTAQLATEPPYPTNGVGGIMGLDAIVRISMAPDGRHLYAISDVPRSIGIFATPRFDFLEADFDGAASPGLDGATGVAVSPDGASVYVTGTNDDAIQQFTRDPETGALNPIQVVRDGVAGVAGLDGARGIAVSPNGNHVYTASPTDDAVAAFTRDAFGFLTFLEREKDGVGSATGLDGAIALVVAPDGRHLYVASGAGSSVAIFPRNQSNGVLFANSTIVDGAGGVDGIGSAQSIAISPDGEHVYVGGRGDDAIAIFSRDVNLGALDFEGFVTSADLDSITGVAVSPDGRFVYATGYLGDALVRYTRHPVAGLLSNPVVTNHVTGADDGLLRPLALSIAPDGAFLFVSGEDGDVIATYRRDAATGDVQLIQGERDGSRVNAALGGVRGLAVSPDGASLYVASDTADAVVTFAPEPGALALGLAVLATLAASARRRRGALFVAVGAGLVVLATPPAAAQFQSNFLTPSVQIGGVLGQTQVLAGSVEIDETGPFDVALTAHVSVEAEPTSDAIYEIAICRDDLPGTQLLGRALWRLTDEDTSSVFEGDTITVTGFDAGVTGPVTHSICARALIGATPPAVTLSARGLDAVPMLPGSGSAGVTDSDLFTDTTIVDAFESVSVTSLDVSRDVAYDVALTAHVVVTFTPNTAVAQSYAISILRDSVTGPRVGSAFYRASRGSDPVTDTIAVTGFDPLRTGTTTYHLGVSRIDADAPALTLELYGMHARTAAAFGRLRGSQVTNILLETAIPSTNSVSLAEVEIGGTAPFDAYLTAHAYVEGEALANDRYAIELCRDDENGARVGLAQWRPLDSASPQGRIGDTVTLTGFDPDRTAPTTYVLCGRKIGSTAPDVTVFQRGIVAEAVSVPEPELAGLAAITSLAGLLLDTRHRRATVRKEAS